MGGRGPHGGGVVVQQIGIEESGDVGGGDGEGEDERVVWYTTRRRRRGRRARRAEEVSGGGDGGRGAAREGEELEGDEGQNGSHTGIEYIDRDDDVEEWLERIHQWLDQAKTRDSGSSSSN